MINQSVPFPRDFLEVAKVILKRLFRVYAHIYHQHFNVVKELQEEAHLNTSFKHFIFFTQEFDLVQKRELAPLQKRIDLLCGSPRAELPLSGEPGSEPVVGRLPFQQSPTVGQMSPNLTSATSIDSNIIGITNSPNYTDNLAEKTPGNITITMAKIPTTVSTSATPSSVSSSYTSTPTIAFTPIVSNPCASVNCVSNHPSTGYNHPSCGVLQHPHHFDHPPPNHNQHLQNLQQQQYLQQQQIRRK
ncbi:unnamed protein product [Protopolystoma xenopodis]|uniref:Uncharacterized protein n=1 Tax=Protopolystoma xenopodis TaxID=117903 RepID=A0A3S5B3D7_9PLAT|nr:unnamed protein product [Protopolystoma xenopodis]